MRDFIGASVVVTRRVSETTQLLLLHRVGYPPGSADWSWTPPGGAREASESPIQTALRELAEESGIIAAPHGLTLISTVPDWYFYHLEVGQSQQIVLDPKEHDEWRWSDLVEAVDLVKPAVVTNAMALAYGAATGRSLSAVTPPAGVAAVLLDMDGTLLRNDQSVSDETRSTLLALSNSKVTPVLVTARPPRAMAQATTEIGISPIALCMNGAMAYDCKSGEILYELQIEFDVLTEVIETLKSDIAGTVFGVQAGFGLYREAGFTPSWPEPEKTEVGPVESRTKAPATTLLARHPELSPAAFLQAVRQSVGDRINVTTSSRTGLVEMTKLGVTKASSAYGYLGGLGIGPDRVLAFGDMPTDTEMIRRAKVGIAVANAHPEAIQASDAVTLSNDEDGVTLALKALLLI